MPEPDDWSRDVWEFCELTATELERFFQSASEAIAAIASEAEAALVADWTQTWEEFWDALGVDEQPYEPDVLLFAEERWEPMATSVVAGADWNPACVGCRHYHGYVYGENFLVCAMHPYGSEDDTCPDWEGKPPPLPPRYRF
ncbi:hypothetical protein KR51_00000110 [Rubidibacter lacunae KORDI 51-2]|uniref:Uncharacterized protein n=1 Tax=Rubidibacter lacunae KORDI 51-2 TaxID=582515 RepID=U5DQM6_9CHRO|nr:hypothetical protein [Rubidibacter lacunae]ERN43122.1 hypothetical protein KR51_00000110 [Rubidibacter lacunae KORDI 51-2]